MDEQEKKKVYQVFGTAWDITKKYCFEPLDDKKWEDFINEMSAKSKDFQSDEKIWQLYRGIMGAVQTYKETKEKERSHGTQAMGALADRTPAE